MTIKLRSKGRESSWRQETVFLEYDELQAETRIKFVRIHFASGRANNATSLPQTGTRSISIRRACLTNVKSGDLVHGYQKSQSPFKLS